MGVTPARRGHGPHRVLSVGYPTGGQSSQSNGSAFRMRRDSRERLAGLSDIVLLRLSLDRFGKCRIVVMTSVLTDVLHKVFCGLYQIGQFACEFWCHDAVFLRPIAHSLLKRCHVDFLAIFIARRFRFFAGLLLGLGRYVNTTSAMASKAGGGLRPFARHGCGQTSSGRARHLSSNRAAHTEQASVTGSSPCRSAAYQSFRLSCCPAGQAYPACSCPRSAGRRTHRRSARDGRG
jgi:hypothetical protein